MSSSKRNQQKQETYPQTYQVERILQRGRLGEQVHYLVKWKGYPMTQNSWQPLSHLTQCQQAINQFENLIKNLENDNIEASKQKNKQNRQKSSKKPSRPKKVSQTNGYIPQVANNYKKKFNKQKQYKQPKCETFLKSKQTNCSKQKDKNQINLEDSQLQQSFSRSSQSLDPTTAQTAPLISDQIDQISRTNLLNSQKPNQKAKKQSKKDMQKAIYFRISADNIDKKQCIDLDTKIKIIKSSQINNAEKSLSLLNKQSQRLQKIDQSDEKRTYKKLKKDQTNNINEQVISCQKLKQFIIQQKSEIVPIKQIINKPSSQSQHKQLNLQERKFQLPLVQKNSQKLSHNQLLRLIISPAIQNKSISLQKIVQKNIQQQKNQNKAIQLQQQDKNKQKINLQNKSQSEKNIISNSNKKYLSNKIKKQDEIVQKQNHRIKLYEQEIKYLYSQYVQQLLELINEKNPKNKLIIKNDQLSIPTTNIMIKKTKILGKYLDLTSSNYVEQKDLNRIIKNVLSKEKVDELDENGDFLRAKIQITIKMNIKCQQIVNGQSSKSKQSKNNEQIQYEQKWIALIECLLYDDKTQQNFTQRYLINIDDLRQDIWKKMFRKLCLTNAQV